MKKLAQDFLFGVRCETVLDIIIEEIDHSFPFGF